MVKLHKRFRLINQTMIDTLIHFKLRANCHGNSLFYPADLSLNFSLSGKKIIKSIQGRILTLKRKLAELARN